MQRANIKSHTYIQILFDYSSSNNYFWFYLDRQTFGVVSSVWKYLRILVALQVKWAYQYGCLCQISFQHSISVPKLNSLYKYSTQNHQRAESTTFTRRNKSSKYGSMSWHNGIQVQLENFRQKWIGESSYYLRKYIVNCEVETC